MKEHVRELERWLKLQFLLDVVKVNLRRSLMILWTAVRGGPEWRGSLKCGAILKELMETATVSYAYNPCQTAVARGDMDHWTLDSILFVLRVLGNKWMPARLMYLVGMAYEVKNFLAFHPTKIISLQDFNSKWDMLVEVLAFYNAPMPQITQDIDSRVKNVSSLFSPTMTNPEGIRVKEMANKLFKQGECLEAFKSVYRILELKSLKEEEKGIFFCNISAYCLKLSEDFFDNEKEFYVKEAASAAKRAITLQPMWAKPYYRLGRAYEVLQKYHKASIAYGEAWSRDRSSDETRKRRDACREKAKRQESTSQMGKDLELPSVKLALEDIQKDMEDPRCNSGCFNISMEIIKMRPNIDSDLVDARCHHRGWGKPVNLKLAAKHYFASACRGNAEAMYTLAIMIKNGEGVKKDVQLAIAMLKQASKLPPFLDFGKPNYGVLEAMHMIGVMYEEGIGVSISSKRAFKWFNRAAEFGLSASLYKVACMYHTGLGVEPDEDSAFGAWYKAFFAGNKASLLPLLKRNLERGEFEEFDRIIRYGFEEVQELNVKTRKALGKLCFLRKHRAGTKHTCRDDFALTEFDVGDFRKLVRKFARKARKPRISNLNPSPAIRSIPVTLDVLAPLEEIMFNDIILDCDVSFGVHENSFLYVVVVDDPADVGGSIGVALEDRNGQMLPGVLYNVGKGPWLKYGTRLYIVNPRVVDMRGVGLAIHVDDPSTLYFHDEDVSQLCRFCRKRSGDVKCYGCGKVSYCSKECRLRDDYIAKHPYVCSKELENSFNSFLYL